VSKCPRLHAVKFTADVIITALRFEAVDFTSSTQKSLTSPGDLSYYDSGVKNKLATLRIRMWRRRGLMAAVDRVYVPDCILDVWSKRSLGSKLGA
jgi:hypothetical protein